MTVADLRASLRRVLSTWAATRLALVALTVFAVAVATLAPSRGGAAQTLVGAWQEWDTNHYLLISRLGYFHVQSANFFPLYPKLLAAIMLLLGDGNGPVWPQVDVARLSVALLLANLAALFALAGTWLLALQQSGSVAAARAAVLVLVSYPLAFFLGAGYAESLFVAFAAFALAGALRGSWSIACICAFLAALARPLGAALWLPLVYEYGRQQGWWAVLDQRGSATRPGARSLAMAAAVAGAVPAGFAVYMAYLWRRFGDPLLFVHTQLHYWHHVTQAPWLTLWQQVVAIVRHRYDQNGAMAVVDLLAVAVAVGVALLALRRRSFALTIYVLCLALLAIISPRYDIPDHMAAASRYMLGAVPVFVTSGEWLASRRLALFVTCSAGFLLQAVFCLAFLAGRPLF